MTGWMILAFLVLMAIASVVVVVVTRTDERKRQERRRRFELTDTGERIPLAPPLPEPTDQPASEEVAAFLASGPLVPVGPGDNLAGTRTEIEPDPEVIPLVPEAEGRSPLGRFVHTPDGEMLLTTPPFRLRETIMSRRNGRYTLALLRRLPPWLVISPKVRLDSILTPTTPDGRDPDDWRQWRHRVRVRAIDLLLCDRRTWQPVLAIMIDHQPHAKATAIAGGKDRIIDEVLASVGLPLVRGTGSFKDDWPVIRPYVEQATLASPLHQDEDALHGGQGWDASAAVTLLRMDDEQGWLLE